MMVRFIDSSCKVVHPGGVVRLDERRYRNEKKNWDRTGRVALFRHGSEGQVSFNKNGYYECGIGVAGRYATFNEAVRSSDDRERSSMAYFKQYGLCLADG